MSYLKPQQRGGPLISCVAWREVVPALASCLGNEGEAALSLWQLWGVGAKQVQAWKTGMGKNTPR